MNRFLFILSFYFSTGLHAQTINDVFEKIRNNAAELTAFFSKMPKGGDLHHHFSGSVYTETFIDIAIEKDYFINRSTLEVNEKPPVESKEWTRFSSLKNEGLLFDYKERLMRKWSAKDYNETDYPSHRQFFESFDHFGVVSGLSTESGLQEIKKRARAENVSYIETMLKTIPCDKNVSDLFYLNERLRNYQGKKNAASATALLDSICNVMQKRKVADCAVEFNEKYLAGLHTSSGIDDAEFTMRYQSFVIRKLDPIALFRNLIIAFEAADKSPLVVGVNIVAPEHHEIPMQDYWLHMQMFKICHSKYPKVRYSMHAGELTLGLVRPEELTWHISSAVYDAQANRIGHGVDMAYEKESYALLKHMSQHDIPVEINLYSNEFILKVKDDRHPLMLYKKFNVPIVISTDDAGILRTNLIEQYVLLAKRYKEIKYADIKRFVYNSIQYSFIKEAALKEKLKSQLDAGFREFEKGILAAYRKPQ